MRWIATLFLAAGTALAQAPTPTPAGNEHVDYWIRTVATHPTNLVRKNAARVLGAMGDRSAVPALVGALKDGFHGVRAEAAKSLGLLTDEGALDALMETATGDSDALVRRNAREAMEKIKSYQEFLKKKQEKIDAAKTSPVQ